MKALLAILLFVSTSAFALDAMVIVLEAPYFSEPNLDSNIVQYARKGDVIKIHPSVANTTAYDHLAPDPKKLSRIRKQLKKSPEWNQDPMFKGDIDDTFSVQDDWIAVLDRQGKRRYMKSDHLYVYYHDRREFVQAPYRRDETDYRLEEPLPEKYPLRSVTGYRGNFLIGLTQPYYNSYPYLSSAKTKGYSSPLDFSVALMKEAGEKRNDRFFFGGTFNLRHFQNKYTFRSGGRSEEENYRFGVGPYISYDAFKGEKNRINLFSAVNVYLFNFLTIKQQSAAGDNDIRTYQAFTVAPKIGFQYQRKDVFPDIDLVAGTALEMELPSRYSAKDGARVRDMWRHDGSDSFTTRFVWNIGAFVGIQSAY